MDVELTEEAMTKRGSSTLGTPADQRRSRLEPRQTSDRVTIRTTDDQLEAIESLVSADIYPNRSEAIRAGIEALIERHESDDAGADRE